MVVTWRGIRAPSLKIIAMNTIKNVHLLADLLPADEIDKLEQAAHLYKRHANITFKILKVRDNELILEVRQEKNFAGKYLNRSELSERTKDLFGTRFTDRTIHTRPIPYTVPRADQVTPEWIKERMNAKKISIKRIVQDTGLDKTNISAWVNGTRPMSQIVKALFFRYFDGWIPTSERLPGDKERVLVATGVEASVGQHLGDGNFLVVCPNGELKEFKEDFWMPIPPTPAINELTDQHE